MEKMKKGIKTIIERINEFFNCLSNSFFSFLKNYDTKIYLLIITFISLILRFSLFNCVRGDYTNFLKPWYQRIYEGGFTSLGQSFGDYTPSYYYLLYFISLFKFDSESIYVLWGIKTISIICDYVIGVFVALIVYHLTRDKIKSILAYFFTIFGLTVFLNSSLWGQCDSIYSSFCIISLYYLLKDKPNKAMIFYGFAFCFKLQSIFFLPVIIVFYLRQKMKLRSLLWVIVIYSLLAIPSCLASDNFFNRFLEIWAVYFNQSANSYKQLTLNAGTFYAMIFTNFKAEEYISSFALFLSIGIIGTYIFLIYRSKVEFNSIIWAKVATLFLLVVPYFLPHMHERYFYLADVVVIIYALINPKKFYVAILAILNSMIGYMVYLWNIPFINVVPQEEVDYTKAMSFRFGAIIYLIAIIFVSIDLFKQIYPNGLKESEKGEVEDGCKRI